MSDPKYIVGIDLGTTNSIVAYTEIEKDDLLEVKPIKILKIPQLVDAGSLDEEYNLPSFLLIPGKNDVPENSLELPWDEENKIAIGHYARNRGVEIPHRLISSTKSWLCHTGVNRNEPILPWEGPDDIQKLSPVESSGAILNHIKNAWNYIMAGKDKSLNLENQEVYLTVPASFDAVARELTVKASETAGLSNITLLEEPQAAFYSWIEQLGEKFRKTIKIGDVILVCDIGGGTTDFSLIKVSEQEGELTLERIAVGDHLLVGGDNMDIALSHIISKKLAENGTKLDVWQMRSLWHNCRLGKEKLYSDKKNKSYPITLLGKGSSVIGGSIKTKLTRDDLDQNFNDGFFPICSKDEKPIKLKKAGMKELGLSYISDPAITHHLADFISKHEQSYEENIFPTAVFFNGGVMKADPLRKRIMKTLSIWAQNENKSVRELSNKDFDFAVARGAAYYGQARHGQGIRIRGGLSKSYYIGIEASLPAVPGLSAPMKALCVAPFGMEEGTETSLNQEFGLIVGEPVKFDFMGSAVRRKDKVGMILNEWQEDIEEITTIETNLEGDEGDAVPVTLEVKVTEVGTLEIWCVSKKLDKKWKLEFNVREKED